MDLFLKVGVGQFFIQVLIVFKEWNMEGYQCLKLFGEEEELVWVQRQYLFCFLGFGYKGVDVSLVGQGIGEWGGFFFSCFFGQ